MSKYLIKKGEKIDLVFEIFTGLCQVQEKDELNQDNKFISYLKGIN